MIPMADILNDIRGVLDATRIDLAIAPDTLHTDDKLDNRADDTKDFRAPGSEDLAVVDDMVSCFSGRAHGIEDVIFYTIPHATNTLSADPGGRSEHSGTRRPTERDGSSGITTSCLRCGSSMHDESFCPDLLVPDEDPGLHQQQNTFPISSNYTCACKVWEIGGIGEAKKSVWYCCQCGDGPNDHWRDQCFNCDHHRC